MTSGRHPGSMFTLALLLACTGIPTLASPRVRHCQSTCRTLIQRGCPHAFSKARCRNRILHQCRAGNADRCELAQACDRSCRPLEAECRVAFESTICDDFAFRRCLYLGAAYCEDPTTVHGCNRLVAEDHRGETMVNATFTGEVAGDYAGRCILVSSGTTVRFEGSFADAPLVDGEAPTPDPSSPFFPPTTTGTSRDFVLATPGIFPYFYAASATSGFPFLFGLPWGAVIVDDAD